MRDDDTGWIELGYVNGVFGVKGWIKVYSYTRPRDGIFDYPTWTLDKNGVANPYQIKDFRGDGTGLCARLVGIDERTLAESLVGARIMIPSSQLPPTVVDEYYWRDLIGLKVENLAGVTFGKVAEVMETGANDVLVVDGDERRLIPFIGDTIIEVNLEAGRIQVNWESDY